jgi:hypothetical protein
LPWDFKFFFVFDFEFLELVKHSKALSSEIDRITNLRRRSTGVLLADLSIPPKLYIKMRGNILIFIWSSADSSTEV